MHVTDRGSGRVVALGHGITMDESIFDAQRSTLEDRYRIITWDAPRHGASPPRNGPYQHEALADDIAAELRARGIERAVIGGLSQGGWLGLQVALRHPDLVEGVVLFSCDASTHDAAQVPLIRAAAQQWAAAGCDPAYAQWSAECNFGPGHPAVELWRDRWLREDGARFHDAFEGMLTRVDLVPRLHEIAVPALVVRGERDDWVPAVEVQRMADALPDATYETIPGAPHTFTVSHPEAATDTLERFLQRLP